MENVNALLDFVYQSENGGKVDYDVVYGKIRKQDLPPKPITQMTVREVRAYQESLRGRYDSRPVGALQIIPSTLDEEIRKGTVSPDDMFDQATQDKLTLSRMQMRGLGKWQAGQMSTEDFGTNMAREWASLPVQKDTYNNGRFVPAGSGFYGGDGINPTRIPAARQAGFQAALGVPQAERASFQNSGTARVSTSGSPEAFLDPAGTALDQPSADIGLRDQALGTLDPARHLKPWERPDVALSDRSGEPAIPPPGAPDEVPQSTRAAPVDFETRTGPGGGPINPASFGQAFLDEATDSFIVRNFKQNRDAQRFEFEPGFDPIQRARDEGLGLHWRFLGKAKSNAHFDLLKRNLSAEEDRRQRQGLGGQFTGALLGGVANPDTLLTLAIPGGAGFATVRSVGGAGVKSALIGGAIIGASEIPIERARAASDPLSSTLDSQLRVAGAAVFGGALFGAIGAVQARGLRRQMMDGIADDVSMMRGVMTATKTADIGDGVKAKVRVADPDRSPIPQDQGPVVIIGDEIVVDEAAIVLKFQTKSHNTSARNANELFEFEVARAASLARDLGQRVKDAAGQVRGFLADESGSVGPGRKIVRRAKDGSAVLNPKEIRAAHKAGEKVRLTPRDEATGVEPVNLDLSRFKSAQSAEEFIGKVQRALDEAADDAAAKAKLDELRTEFLNRKLSNEKAEANFKAETEAQKVKREKARADAAVADDALREKLRARRVEREKVDAELRAQRAGEEAIENFRKENNRIFQSAVTETLARMLDSPFKRLHRNSFAPEVRDMADKLAADGAFLARANDSGLTVGSSVYSRVRTWNGVLRRLWDKETELFEKYLGFESNPNLADVPVNKSFRRTRADGLPAITVDQFQDRTTKALITGIKDPVPEINEMAEHLRGALAEYQSVGENLGVLSSSRMTATQIDALKDAMLDMAQDAPEFATAAARLEQLAETLRAARVEPNKDYFTRVYRRKVIQDNREQFKELVVKPHMRQQPFGDVWSVGKNEIGPELDALKRNGGTPEEIARMQKRFDEAPETSRYERKKFSTRPEDIDKRAEELIDTILDEAEPDDLSTLRAPSRPTFGRKRQLNVPNELMLKDGPNGNGVADFIETDYLLVTKIYNDRMAPAIEMARAFARPADGVNAAQGFEEALANAKRAERQRWDKANTFGKGTKREIDEGFFLEGPEGANSPAGRAARAAADAEFAEHWAPMERDLIHLRDRVENRVMRDPTRWDNRAATVLKQWAQLALMGGSALSTIPEFGRVVARNGMRRTFQQAFGDLDAAMSAVQKAGIQEMRNAGGIMDMVNGAALSHFAETGADAIGSTGVERFLRVASNKYFLWNGLAQFTTRLKELDAGLRVSDTVARIKRVADLNPSEDDLRELSRFGISREMAMRMADEPMTRVEGGGWLANTDQWGDEGLVRSFRAAIFQGNENTVLMATAADKPTIVDGVIFLRRGGLVDKYARRAGLEEVGDFWRVQSGLLSLPFTFWNYSIAASNKILLSGIDEPSAQKLAGMASMVGLGYMTAGIKDPLWDSRSTDERIAKAIDQSGIMGVLAQARDIAGQNSVSGTIKRVAGAGPATAINTVAGVVSGDFSQASWGFPGRNHLLLKDLFDSFIDLSERREMGVE